jgi:tetratricopeptide (TPR) repeat protein
MKCLKEKIFVDFGNGDGASLTYYLSNNINDIKETIYKTIGSLTDLTDDMAETCWTLNLELSENVKDLMNKHNADYSLTFYQGITVNRRFGDSWYIYHGINPDGGKIFYSREKYRRYFEKIFPELSKQQQDKENMNREEQNTSTEGAANAAIHLNRGKEYVEAGDYDAAIAEFDQTLAINAELSEAWFWRGKAYGINGNFDQAISDYTAALRIDPDE